GDYAKFYGGIGYTSSKIKRFDFNAATMASVGNQVPFTTKLTVNAGFEHILPLTDHYQIVTRLDWERRGKTYFHEGGTFVGVPVRDPINFLSGRIALTQANGWSLAVWGKNLINEKYYEEVIVPDFNFQGRPRTYGAELNVSF
ncbi:MAG: TonB-dependent receptor, partial [Alphaproteobacteria bacterium]